MQRARILKACTRFVLPLLAIGLTLPAAHADSCVTQSQIAAQQRQELTRVAHSIVSEVQSSNIQGLRNDTLPAVAADFSGIQNSAQALAPVIQPATITVDALFAFEAAQAPQGAVGSQFFCSPAGSSMTVVLNFSTLPPGKYALAILHATGVPKPQQVTLILAQDPQSQWKLAGFFTKPMMLAGQNGLWYWTHARDYAQKKMDWAAWFYYQTAAFLVNPVDFLSSPNTDKLRQEADKVRPQNLPSDKPMTVQANTSAFEVTRVDTSIDLGPLDLAIHYNPSDAQAAQLRDPVAARKQVVDLMAAVLALHPELRSAFHGVYVYADTANATVFALELPMDQIPNGTSVASSTPGSSGQ
jgi:hypothetical protein